VFSNTQVSINGEALSKLWLVAHRDKPELSIEEPLKTSIALDYSCREMDQCFSQCFRRLVIPRQNRREKFYTDRYNTTAPNGFQANICRIQSESPCQERWIAPARINSIGPELVEKLNFFPAVS
jgi:hypothetical protein